MIQEAGWDQDWSEWVLKMLPPLVFDSRTVQPVVSCYTIVKQMSYVIILMLLVHSWMLPWRGGEGFTAHPVHFTPWESSLSANWIICLRNSWDTGGNRKSYGPVSSQMLIHIILGDITLVLISHRPPFWDHRLAASGQCINSKTSPVFHAIMYPTYRPVQHYGNVSCNLLGISE